MLKMSDKSNLLEQSTYRYSLQDVNKTPRMMNCIATSNFQPNPVICH